MTLGHLHIVYREEVGEQATGLFPDLSKPALEWREESVVLGIV
jgi:hypothetical protein